VIENLKKQGEIIMMKRVTLYFRVISEWGEDDLIYDLGKSIQFFDYPNGLEPTEKHIDEMIERILETIKPYEDILEEEYVTVYLVDDKEQPYYSFDITNDLIRQDIVEDEEIYNDISEIAKYNLVYIKENSNLESFGEFYLDYLSTYRKHFKTPFPSFELFIESLKINK
jgi:hypothetical protein